jgi:hypothetical protein
MHLFISGFLSGLIYCGRLGLREVEKQSTLSVYKTQSLPRMGCFPHDCHIKSSVPMPFSDVTEVSSSACFFLVRAFLPILYETRKKAKTLQQAYTIRVYLWDGRASPEWGVIAAGPGYWSLNPKPVCAAALLPGPSGRSRKKCSTEWNTNTSFNGKLVPDKALSLP